MADSHAFAPDESNGRGYQSIRDYALIGDCHGSALVARDGSIDWCYLGRFDAEPVLWRLLDARHGAFFQIQPVHQAAAERAYLPDTNILRTVFTTAAGRVAVTDFMPVGRAPEADPADYVTLNAPGWLVRIVEGLEGHCELRVKYRNAARPFEKGFNAAPTPVLYTEAAPDSGAPAVDSTLTIRAGERRVFVIAPNSDAVHAPATKARRMLPITQAFWQQWCHRCWYQGRYGDQVRRSALTLKALTFAPSGAIVAAPTTSLPEEPGGVRNWDYRFSWLRDSSFVLQALAALGYSGEARGFCEFLRVCCVETLPDLQILYGITQETSLPERSLDHLEGYNGARPVRVGNAAHAQRQVDIYGELADWALMYRSLGEPLDTTLEQMIRGMADHVAVHWREPDQGIWEMRGEPRHHVHGKVMAWVALDRALRLLGPNPQWEAARAEVLDAILTNGVDPVRGHLVQAFGYDDVDAALLLVPLLDTGLDRAMLARTVSAVEGRLRVGDYVYRYLDEDGLPGGEGAFLICSFWLVDALLVLDRAEEARALFERLLQKANDVGLYAEEIDPANNGFLGNYPQAFTHLALINSAIHLHLHETGGPQALAGTEADRARRAAEQMVREQPLRHDQFEAPDKSAAKRSILDWTTLTTDERPSAGE
jgi:GH15 family glucan-1,4-alpha-glucosidase